MKDTFERIIFLTAYSIFRIIMPSFSHFVTKENNVEFVNIERIIDKHRKP
jgi:hypothetical protein